MPAVSSSPPRAPTVKYNAPNGTRWQKEKAAAGADAFELPDDPKHIGPWIIGECVGKGASGRVKIAKHRRTGQLAAVKILPLQPLVNSRASLATQQAKSEKQRLGIDREITMMKLMNHPNIMRIYDVFEGEKELFLVLEYVEGGELFDFLVNRGRLPPLDALAYFKQIIYALNFAHAFSIIHRDLKPENILIHSLNPPLIKIADWGMAAFAPPSLQLETSCGSPHYASPEIVNGDKYEGGATDIWSCGVILYALLTGRLPFDDKNVRTLLAKVKLGKYDMPAYVDPQAKDLLTRMLVVNVSKRITISEILMHPWFLNETPGIQYVPAPPVAELARPLRSAAHIDRDLMSSLRVIWGRHATSTDIRADLLSPAGEGTLAKAFYFLLQKYRETTLEEHGIINDVNELGATGKVITKQYTAPPARSEINTKQLLVDPHASRERSSGGSHGATRTPSPNPPGLTSPSPGKPSSRARPSSPNGPRPNKGRPLSTPAPPAPAVTSPRSRHSHLPTNAAMLGPPFNQTGAVLGRPRSATAENSRTHTPSLQRGEASSRTQYENNHRIFVPMQHPPLEISSVLFPGLDRAASTPAAQRSSTAEGVPLPLSPAPHSAASPQHIHAPVAVATPSVYDPAPLPMIAAPQTTNPELQRRIDDITDKVNVLVARGNAEIAEQNRISMYTPGQEQQAYFPPYPPPNPRRNVDKENKASKRRHSETDPMQISGGLGFVKPQHRGGVMGREMGNIIYVGESAPKEPSAKERKERKSRPPTMDFHSKALNTKRSTMSVVGSPATSQPPSSMMGSPTVGEVKGWFSNLFNWKAQSFMLYSDDNIFNTRTETTRLLEQFGVTVTVEDAEGWGILRCRVDDAIDDATGALQKQTRFRVEFSLATGGISAGSPQPGAVTPRNSQVYQQSAAANKRYSMGNGGKAAAGAMSASTMCAIILHQEKGSVSTFRTVYRRLREDWRLDALSSPPIGWGPQSGAATPLMEHAHNFMA